MASTIGSAKDIVDNLLQPSARQMLWQLVENDDSVIVDPLREVFISELEALGDFPQNPTKYATASGNGTITPNASLPGTPAYSFSACLRNIMAEPYIEPEPDQDVPGYYPGYVGSIKLPQDTDEKRCYAPPETPAFDNAPGGRGDVFDGVYEMLNDLGIGTIELYNDGESCFIPTVSAVSFHSDNPHYPFPPSWQPEANDAFDEVHFYTSGENGMHQKMTEEMTNWILEKLTT